MLAAQMDNIGESAAYFGQQSLRRNGTSKPSIVLNKPVVIVTDTESAYHLYV